MSQLPENHPLLEKAELPAPYSFYEWLQEWKQATHYIHLDALLYQGFSQKVNVDSKHHRDQERLRFYLTIAEGFSGEPEAFEVRDTPLIKGEGRDQTVWMRKRLAEKAFAILIQHVFKNSEDQHGPPSWQPLLDNDETFEAVLAFLRVDPETKRIANLPQPPSELRSEGDRILKRQRDTLCKFILDFVRLGFSGKLKQSFNQERVEAAYPQFIELLVRLGEAKRLLDRDAYPLIDGSGCWEILEGLALEPLTVGKAMFRPEEVIPASVEEAAALGSEAAQVLILRGQFREYDNRQAEIEAARALREQADARLEQLSA